MADPKRRNEAPQYLLRFIAGKYQGSEYPLPPETEIVVGRGADLDLVLAEEKVSRRHARISTLGGELTVFDLGSTNGTFLNGARVTQARLKQGDRILIGSSIMKVISADDSSPTVAALSMAEMRVKMEELSRESTRSLTIISGNLEEVPLPDLLQMLANLKKTGVLKIHSEQKARVHLRQGSVYWVAVEPLELHPLKAAYRIFLWKKGAFQFHHSPPEPFEGEITLSNDALILEAMRQMDELDRIGPQLPAPGERVFLAMPLEPRLAELSPPELDVLQVAYNHHLVADVLDRCPGTDLDVCTHLVSLIERGYLQVERGTLAESS
jgi:hypothetical protein